MRENSFLEWLYTKGKKLLLEILIKNPVVVSTGHVIQPRAKPKQVCAWTASKTNILGRIIKRTNIPNTLWKLFDYFAITGQTNPVGREEDMQEYRIDRNGK